MEITSEKLTQFANNPINEIEYSFCNFNAIRVYNEFGGEIHLGNAYFYSFEHQKINYVRGHIWNVLQFQSRFATIEKQIIDIYNYKEDVKGIYFGYIGSEISIENVPK